MRDGARRTSILRNDRRRSHSSRTLIGPLRILLADDHAMVRQGLRKLLEECPEWEVIAEAGDGGEAVRLAEQHRPDLAILDIAMPLLNGIEATREIAMRSPNTRVLLLSMHADDAYVTQGLQAGATGYLLKEAADADLLTAANEVAHGRSFLSPSLAHLIDDHSRQSTGTGVIAKASED